MTVTDREAPHHRSLTCVKEYRCRRPECRARSADYDRTRNRLVAYGRWQPLIDAEPARQHVRMLGSFGIGWQRACRLSGVSNGGMSRLLYGDYGRGRGPSKRIRTETADRIYTVRADISNVADCAVVDGTGTRRRLQALVAQGWPQLQLAHRMDLEFHTVNELVNGADSVIGSTARATQTLYNRLWNVDPASRSIAPRYITQAKRIARFKNWAPPGAWDDEYIDSPSATPDLGEHVDRYTAIAEDARWLISSQGYTNAQAAHRLGITKDHLFRAFNQRPVEVAA